MIKQYQVTMLCTNNKYKPVSTIVKMEDTSTKREILIAGQRKIMLQHYWTMKDLERMTFTKIKMREYDKEKIARENAERYERIKEEKYASGEWKRPKKDLK